MLQSLHNLVTVSSSPTSRKRREAGLSLVELMVAVLLLAVVAAITIGIVISSSASSTNIAHATASQTQVNTAANTLQRDLSMAQSITLAEKERIEFQFRQGGQEVQAAVFGYIPGETTNVPAFTKTNDLPNYTAIIYVRSFSNGTVSQDILVSGWNRDGYQGNPLFRYYDAGNAELTDTSTAELRDKIIRVGFYIAAHAEGRSSQVQIQSSVTPAYVSGNGEGPSTEDNPIIPPAVPSCPANLQANVTQSNQSVTVTWAAPEGATSYIVYMRDAWTGNLITPYSINLPTTTTLTVPGLTPGMTYQFGIQANGPGGLTGECDNVRATIAPNGTDFVNLNSLAGMSDLASNNTSDIRTSPVRTGIATYSRTTTKTFPGHRYTVARDLTNLLTWKSVPGAAEYIVYRVGTATPLGRVSGDANFHAPTTSFSFQDPDRAYGDSTRYYVVTSNAGGTGIASPQVTLNSPPRASQFNVTTPDTSTRATTTDAVFDVQSQFSTTVGHTVQRASTTSADADCSAALPAGYMNTTSARLTDPQAPWGSASCYRFIPFNDAGNGISSTVEVDQKPGKFNVRSFTTIESMVWIDGRKDILPWFAGGVRAQCWVTEGRTNYQYTKPVGSTRASCLNGYTHSPNGSAIEPWQAGKHATEGDKFAIGLFGTLEQRKTNIQLTWAKSQNAGAGYDAIRDRIRTTGQANVGTAGKVSYSTNYSEAPSTGQHVQGFINEMPGSEFTGEIVAKAHNGLTRSSTEGGNGLAHLITAPDIPSHLGNEWWTKGNAPYLKVRMHFNTQSARGFSSNVNVFGRAWNEYGDEFNPTHGRYDTTSYSAHGAYDGPAYGGNASQRREHREEGWQHLDIIDGAGKFYSMRSQVIGVTGATAGCVKPACGTDWAAVPEDFPVYLPGGYYRYNAGAEVGPTTKGENVAYPPFEGGSVIIDEGGAVFCSNYSESDPLFTDTYGCNLGTGIPPQVTDLVNVKTVGDKSTISWKTMVNAYSGYVVTVTEADGTKNTYATPAGTTTLTLPVDGTRRIIDVAAKNTIATGPASDPITVQPLAPPTFATGFSLDNVLKAETAIISGAEAYTVHWRQNGGAAQSAPATIQGSRAVANVPNTAGSLTQVWFTAQNDAGKTTSLAGDTADFNGLLAPSNIRYNVNGNSAIVTWDAVPEAEYYVLYQDGNPTNYASGARVNGVSHTVTVPVTTATSKIVVRAYNTEPKGESYSKVSATLSANGLNTVSGVATVTTNNRTTVTWNATPNATQYDLLYRIAGGAQQTVTLPAATRTYSMDVNAAGGQVIDVQVRARKLEGVGALSPNLSYTTIGKPVITDYKLTGENLEVTVSDTAGAENRGTIFWQFGTGAIQSKAITVDGTDGTPVTIPGVVAAPVSYWVQMNETRPNVNTTSVDSDKRTVQGLAAPTNIVATTAGSNGKVSWDAVPGATAYEVFYRAVGETAWTKASSGSSPVVFPLPAIDTEVKVRALGDGGKVIGLDSAIRELNAPVVERPTGLTVNAVGGNVTVNWAAVEHADTYDFSYTIAGSAAVKTNQTGTSKSFTVPTDGKLVTISVNGKNALMTGEAATATVTPLAQPQVQNYTVVDDILQINPRPLSGPTNYINVAYKLNDGAVVTRQVPAAGGALNIPGLSGAKLDFTLTAFGGAANVTTASVASANVTELPLATPTGFRVLSVDGAEATITWNPVANATGYRIYQDGNPNAYESGALHTGNTIVVDVPVNGDASTLVVRAVRTSTVAGVAGTQYSKASAAIQAKGVGVVTGLNLSSLGGSLTANWNATPNAQRYEVVSDVAGASSVSAVPTGLTYTRTGLPTAGQTINLKVRAVTDLGNGPWNTVAVVLIAQPVITSYTLTDDVLTVNTNNPAGNENTHELRYTINGGATQVVSIGASSGSRDLNVPAGSVVRFWVEKAQIATSLALRSVPSATTTATVLATPTLNVSVAGVQANLSWNAIAGAGLYEVNYRQQGTGAWTKETFTTRTATIDLPAAITEIYVVAVQSSTVTQVRSGNSNTMVVTAPVLSAPSNIQYRSDDNAVRVTWDEVLHASTYEVHYRVNTGATQVLEVSTNSADFTIPAGGNNLYVQVRAINRLVTGILSPSFYWATIGTPTITAMDTASGDSFSLTANNPNGNESKGTVYYTIGDGAVQTVDLPVSTRTVRVPMTDYEGKMITAWVVYSQETSNLQARSAESAKVSRHGLDFPTLDYRVVGPNATVTWNAVPLAGWYGVRYAVDTNPTGETAQSPRTLDLVIPAGKTMNVQVRSAQSNARSLWGPILSLKELLAPTGLTSNVEGDQATISWNAVPDADNYTLYYGVPSGATQNMNVTGTSASITLPSNPAHVWVVAHADGGKRESLPTAKLTVGQLAAPVLSGTVVRGDEVSLSWNAITGATSYEIEYRQASTGNWSKVTQTGTTRTMNLPAVLSDFRVQAIASANLRSSESNTLMVQALAPAVPTAGAQFDATEGNITISWGAVPDADDYDLSYRIESGATTVINKTTTSHNLTVTPGQAVFYTIRANNRLVSSAYTAQFGYRTIAAPSLTAYGLVGDEFSYTLSNPLGNETNTTVFWKIGTGAVQSKALGSAARYTGSVILPGIGGQAAEVWFSMNQVATGANITSVETTKLAIPGMNPPTNLRFTSVSAQTAALAWDAVAGATGYEISYRAVGGAWATTTSTGTTRSVVLPATVNEVFVRATWNGGAFKSHASETITIETFGPTVASVEITKDGDDAIISWDRVPGAAEYGVYYRTATQTAWTAVVYYSTDTSVTHAMPAETTEYQVLTRNGTTRNGGWSNIVVANAVKPATFNATTSSFTSVGGKVTLSWNAMPDVAGYDVYYRPTASAAYQTVTTTSTNITFDHAAGNNVTYQVRAKNRFLDGDLSAAKTQQSLGTPTVTVTSIVGDRINYSVNDVAGPDTSGVLTYKVDGVTSSVAIPYTARAGFITVAGLATKSVEMSAVLKSTATGYTATSDASAVTLASGIATPASMRVTGQTGTSIDVAWNAVAGATGYELGYKQAADATWTTVTLGNVLTSNVTATGTDMQFRVQAFKAGDITSNPSNIASTSVIATPAFTLAMVGGTQAKVTWAAAANAGFYKVFYRTSGSTGTPAEATTTGTTLTINMPNRVTEVWVQAYRSSAALGFASDEAAAQTVTAPYLSTPTGFNVDVPAGTDATVTWGAVANATSYQVGVKIGTGAEVLTTVTGTSHSFDVPAANAGQNVSVRVIAKNALLNSTWSGNFIFQTIAQPVISTFKLTAPNSLQVTVANPAGGETSMRLYYRINGGAVQNIAGPLYSGTYTIAGLNSTSQAFEFWVKASQIASGRNINSLDSDSKTTSALAAPTGLSMDRIDVNTGYFSWNPVAGADGYILLTRQTGTTTWTETVVAGGATTTASRSLPAMTNEAAIQATKDGGAVESLPSAAITANKIVAPTATGTINAETVTLNWNAIAGASRYQVWNREAGTTSWQSRSNGPTVTTWTGPANFLDNEFMIIAVMPDTSRSVYGNTVSLTPAVPAAPTGLSVDATGTAATVSWNTTANASSYQVGVKIGTGAETLTTVPGTSHSFTAAAGADVTVRVRALNSFQSGPFTANLVFQTIGAPSPTATTVNGDDVNVTLSSTITGSPTSATLFYQIGTGAWKSVALPSLTGGVVTLSGITSASQTLNFYAVYYQNDAQRTITSPDSRIWTRESLATPVLTGTAPAAGQSATWSWGAIANATTYRIYYKAVSASTWSSTTTSSTSWTWNNITAPAHAYVVAYGSSTNSFSSNTVAVTPLLTLPTVTGITWTKGSTSTNPGDWWASTSYSRPVPKPGTLSWNAVVGAGKYRVYKNGVLVTTTTARTYTTPVDAADATYTVTATTSTDTRESLEPAGYIIKGTSSVPTAAGGLSTTWLTNTRNTNSPNQIGWSLLTCAAGYNDVYYVDVIDSASNTHAQRDWDIIGTTIDAAFNPRDIVGGEVTARVRTICVDPVTNYPSTSVGNNNTKPATYRPASAQGAPTVSPKPVSVGGKYSVTATAATCHAGTTALVTFEGLKLGVWSPIVGAGGNTSRIVNQSAGYTSVRTVLACTFVNNAGQVESYFTAYSPATTVTVWATPSAPTNLTVDRIYGHQAFISWTVPANTSHFDVTYDGTTTRVAAQAAGTNQTFNFKANARNNPPLVSPSAWSVNLPANEAAKSVSVRSLRVDADDQVSVGTTVYADVKVAPTRIFPNEGYSLWRDSTNAYGGNFNRTVSGMNTVWGNSMVSADGTNVAIYDANQKLRIYKLTPTTVTMKSQWNYLMSGGREIARLDFRRDTYGGYIDTRDAANSLGWTSQTSASWGGAVYMFVMENDSSGGYLTGYGRAVTGAGVGYYYQIGTMANEAPGPIN